MKKKHFLLFTVGILILWSILYGQEYPHKIMERDCQDCHNPDNWKMIRFNHSTTSFPLEGNHRDVFCVQCHNIQNFQDTGSSCRNCHTDVHQSRLGPWCQACHTPQSWTVIDHARAHANTVFPLLGVHARLDCGSCHYSEIEGEFSPLQSDCYSCHKEEYNSVQVPNHVEAGFSKVCETCHSFYAWKPAEFAEHDPMFPIFRGSHSGVWNQCSDCHISPGNYAIFSCLTCHEHSRDRMDRSHREVSGYVYDSQHCYSCHPTGTGGD